MYVVYVIFRFDCHSINVKSDIHFPICFVCSSNRNTPRYSLNQDQNKRLCSTPLSNVKHKRVCSFFLFLFSMFWSKAVVLHKCQFAG